MWCSRVDAPLQLVLGFSYVSWRLVYWNGVQTSIEGDLTKCPIPLIIIVVLFEFVIVQGDGSRWIPEDSKKGQTYEGLSVRTARW